MSFFGALNLLAIKDVKKMKLINFCVLLPVVLLLSGCMERSKNIPSFANPATPEYRALTFFDALYNQKDLKLALKYASKDHARIIKSYGTTKGYARYVLNLQFDPGVDLKIDRSLNQIQFGDPNKTHVNILFTGTYLDRPVNDLRKVVFKKVKNEWLITKIAGDPYARNR